MDSVDKIFNTINYNNVFPTVPTQEFIKKRDNFENRLDTGKTSMWENCKWETLPYLLEWFKYSSIAYVISIILIIIRIFIK